VIAEPCKCGQYHDTTLADRLFGPGILPREELLYYYEYYYEPMRLTQENRRYMELLAKGFDRALGRGRRRR
jgi:hypothetical protein